MKICLVASSMLDISPYISRYVEFAKEKNISYDIIEKRPVGYKGKKEATFSYEFSTEKRIIGRFLRFVKYACFTHERFQQNYYNRVILFSATDSTFCYCLNRRLLKNKYMVDLRDYERIVQMPILRRLFYSCIKNAELVVISSPRFVSWLPSDCSAIIMHNLPPEIHINEHSRCFQSRIIRIGYFGGIGYYTENVALVNALSESKKYHIVYRGIYPDKENIKDYCQEQSIRNVSFYGKYANEDKRCLYEEVDFINAIYGNSSKIVTTALPNKLYDCLCYKIPIIASKGTYLAEVVEECGVGVAVDVIKDDIEEKLDDYIAKFDRETFEENCNLFLDRVICEQKKTDKLVGEFLEGKGT